MASDGPFPCAIFGVNLSKRLPTIKGGPPSAHALLDWISDRYDELDAERGGDPNGESFQAQLFREFQDRLAVVLGRERIGIPTLEEAKDDDGNSLVTINRIDSHAEIAEGEEFEPGDLILGIGILAFPNKVPVKSMSSEWWQWHLYTVD